jgi:hypothetical protein
MRHIELKRTLKTQAVQDPVNVLDQWQRSTQTFDQDVAIEMHDAGRNYLQSYLRIVTASRKGDFNAVIDSPIGATVVEHMLHYLPKETPRAEAIDRCVKFFQSEHFSQVPNEWILNDHRPPRPSATCRTIRGKSKRLGEFFLVKAQRTGRAYLNAPRSDIPR